MGTSWMRRLFTPMTRGASAVKGAVTFRPYLEELEERAVPALAVTTNLTPQALVADLF